MCTTRILGISAYYHDAAAALVEDGRIIAASQEERFSRIKQDPSFPKQAIDSCLQLGKTSLAEVDYVVFYDKPFLKLERLLETYLAFAPRGFRSFRRSMPVWMADKLFQKKRLLESLTAMDPAFAGEKKLLFTEHHQAHAASAFYPSPFREAAVLTLDGVGEWATTSMGIGRDNQLQILREIHFPHSLGLFYAAFTSFTGFQVNSGEYKMMGLAPYGEPRYVQTILEHLIDVKADGSFRLNLDYFDYCTGNSMTNHRFAALFGGPARPPEGAIGQREMDLAASAQRVTEEIVLRLARSLVTETGMENLCLAGGVALNGVANGRLHREGICKKIWVQPAAGDAGGALGAALAAYHWHLGKERALSSGMDAMSGALLGPAFSQTECETQLDRLGAKWQVLADEPLLDACVHALAAGEVLGWHQGRMEFGPRALGGRSILADPRLPDMQRRLNQKIKFRESFRPFAPSVLRERVEEWFLCADDSPYMLRVEGLHPRRRRPLSAAEEALQGLDKLHLPRSEIPAVTHVDCSARLQTVHRETNPKYHALLSRFAALTGCPVLVNTSFNIRDEPIVCSPTDAFRCFMGTGMDTLVVGNCLLRKADQTSL
ncbi:MAG: carbamoyltransferase [Magnetococcus sp. YQC-3]